MVGGMLCTSENILVFIRIYSVSDNEIIVRKKEVRFSQTLIIHFEIFHS